MSDEPKKTVVIVELSDRYLVVDAATKENVDDAIGFCDEESACLWAERNGYKVVDS